MLNDTIKHIQSVTTYEIHTSCLASSVWLIDRDKDAERDGDEVGENDKDTRC